QSTRRRCLADGEGTVGVKLIGLIIAEVRTKAPLMQGLLASRLERSRSIADVLDTRNPAMFIHANTKAEPCAAIRFSRREVRLNHMSGQSARSVVREQRNGFAHHGGEGEGQHTFHLHGATVHVWLKLPVHELITRDGIQL